MELLLCGSFFFFAVVAGVIGAQKGEPVKAALVGFFFGPLGVILALLSSGDRRPCPQCRESINREATICPRCHSAVTPAPPQSNAAFYVIAAVPIAALVAWLWFLRTLD